VPSPDGAAAEVVEASLVVDTSATGLGVGSLALTRGGRYTVRARVADARGHRASATAPLTVTGRDDPVRLRVLIERDVVPAGAQALLRVVWWGAPQDALATIEAGRVLEHRIVRLQTGENRLAWDMKEAFSPNVSVAVAVVGRDQLHSTSREIVVARRMDLAVSPDRPTHAPGDEVELSIVAADQMRRPVDAEVSVAVVDEALLALFPDPLPPMADTFAQRRSPTALSVASSAGTTRAAEVRRSAHAAPAAERPKMRAKSKKRRLREGETTVEEVPLTDVPKDDPAYEAIQKVIDAGVLEGHDGKFHGDKPVDRRQMAIVMARLLDRVGVLKASGKVITSQDIANLESLTVEFTDEMNLLKSKAALFREAIDRLGRKAMPSMFPKVQAMREELSSIESAIARLSAKLSAVQQRARGPFAGARDIAGAESLAIEYADDLAQLNVKVSTLADDLQAIEKGRRSGPRGGATGAPSGPDAVRVRELFYETAFWAPAVRTGPSGQARVRFRLPDGLTRYRIIARGVTASTLVGEATGTVAAHKPVVSDLLVPAAFVEGDEGSCIALVRGDAGGATPLRLVLDAQGAEVASPAERVVTLLPGQEARIPMRIRPGSARRSTLTLTVRTADGNVIGGHEDIPRRGEVGGGVGEGRRPRARGAAPSGSIGGSVEYPDLSVVEAAELGLVHRVLEYDAKRPPARDALGAALAKAFLLDHPGSPMADEATLALAAAHLQTKAFEEALRWASAGERRYPDSPLLDTLRVIAGWALLSRGDPTAAAGRLGPVAERGSGRPPDPAVELRQGRLRASARVVEPSEPPVGGDDRALVALARYLLAQCHQAAGRVTEAIKGYRAVADDFPEAGETADELEERVITCPEITRARPGATAVLEVGVKNVSAIHLRTYAVDLLGLHERASGGLDVGRVALAGIRSAHVTTVAVEGSQPGRSRTLAVPLPVRDQGAYLVILEGEGARSSGLVLLSGITAELRERSTAGRVSVQVRHEPGGQPAAGAYVRVSGAPGGRVAEGMVDARGVFMAEGIAGTPTVLARLGGSFALASGRRSHSPEDRGESGLPPAGAELRTLVERARAVGAPRASYLREVVLDGERESARSRCNGTFARLRRSSRTVAGGTGVER
jgi:hypothetical protein